MCSKLHYWPLGVFCFAHNSSKPPPPTPHTVSIPTTYIHRNHRWGTAVKYQTAIYFSTHRPVLAGLMPASSCGRFRFVFIVMTRWACKLEQGARHVAPITIVYIYELRRRRDRQITQQLPLLTHPIRLYINIWLWAIRLKTKHSLLNYSKLKLCKIYFFCIHIPADT